MKIAPDKRIVALQKSLRKHNEVFDDIRFKSMDIIENLQNAMGVIADKEEGTYSQKDYQTLLYWIQQFKWLLEMQERFVECTDDQSSHMGLSLQASKVSLEQILIDFDLPHKA